jgi:hypothetical protein
MKTTDVRLEERDLRILVQSLRHCLDTCETRQQKPDAPCEDCDAARDLMTRLQKALEA